MKQFRQTWLEKKASEREETMKTLLKTLNKKCEVPMTEQMRETKIRRLKSEYGESYLDELSDSSSDRASSLPK